MVRILEWQVSIFFMAVGLLLLWLELAIGLGALFGLGAWPLVLSAWFLAAAFLMNPAVWAAKPASLLARHKVFRKILALSAFMPVIAFGIIAFVVAFLLP